MSEDIKNVIIIGAGGNLGPHVLSALDSDPHFTVSILSRQESTSTFPPHLKVHKTDYTLPSLVSAFKGQDAVVSTISATENHVQHTVIDAAVQAGVKRFIPADFGSNTANPKTVALVPILKGKTDVTDYLKTKESEGLSWTAVVNGPFFDWGLTTSFLGFDLPTHHATIFDSGHTKWSTTTLPTIGRSIASILHHPTETRNKHILISSFTVSQLDVLHALESASGTKWDVTYTTTEQQLKEGREKLEKSDWSGVMNLLLAATYGEGNGGDYGGEGLSNDMLGLPKEELQPVVDKVVKGEKL